MKRSRCRVVAVAACVVLCACDFRRFTADSTADMIHAGSSQFNTLEDLTFAEAAAPGNLVTLENVWRVAPDNPDLLSELVQGWSSYSFAFLEDAIERATSADDVAGADVYRERARAAYTRARTFGWLLCDQRVPVSGGTAAQVRRGIAPWRAHLARYRSRADVPALYWTATAWLSWIQLSVDDTGALLDLPFAVAMMERARALDPEYARGGIHTFYGLYYSGTPASLGGRPDESRREFEAAMAASGRRLLINQVLCARNYAVQVQDRALFLRLLEEVLAAGDVLPEERLTNQVAKRRARRYLDQIDDLFAPPGDV